MLYNDFTKEMIGLQDVIVTNIKENEKKLTIYAKLERKSHECPCCKTKTDTIHDYREQIIKDIPAFGKQVSIVLRKRRYRCTECGKRFFEKNSFLPKYHRMTNRLSAYVIDKLHSECSYTSVARQVFLSVSTVIRIFDIVSYPKGKLPTVLAIDEFKGNTGGEKYNCIITDPENKIVLDILPKRHEHYLSSYFRTFEKDVRNGVKYFVSDMWKPFDNVADTYFKKADHIVDKYHWIRQIIWAFEKVRKEEQKKFSKTHRRYFKNSRKLLLKRFDSLNDEQKQQVNIMLYTSVNLSRAYWYKEEFLKILDSDNRETARVALSNWINSAYNSNLQPIQKCADTMKNWLSGILNSFSVPFTNGFTEGCNNKIKVLKRNAYGYRNFNRFRNRILHIFSYKSAHAPEAVG